MRAELLSLYYPPPASHTDTLLPLLLYVCWGFICYPRVNPDQIRSVAQSCPTLCDPMNRSMPGLPVHHQLPEFTQTHVHQVSDAIQPSHPLSSLSPLAPNPSQHQSLFQWVNSSHEVANQDSKRDTDVKNRLLDSVGEGEGGTIWENSIETYILSYVK